MTGRSPARLLAPLALVVSAVALFAVITSGGDGGSSSSSTSVPTPTATATAKPERRRDTSSRAKTYTVKAGDTPSSIAQANGVDVDDLLAANPDADPGALSVGQKLKLP